MNYLKLLLILFCVSCISCKKSIEKSWYKGNLHTHSYWSDGDEFPEVVMDWYKKNGYQFVALSDHNTFQEGEKWVEISKDSVYQNAFVNYLDKYGAIWVEQKIDSGRLFVKLKTLDEYKGRFQEEGKFLIIPSEEITDGFDNKPLHMNATNIQKEIEAQGGSTVADVLQNNINAVLAQREELNVPIMPHINHPNFGFGISLNDMMALKGERFFEVYNGHPAVHNSGDSTHMSTEEMWDRINISYLKDGKPVMHGLATDDAHNYHRKGITWSNAGRGWVMVLSESLTPESLISSMEAGDFYSSTGVALKNLKFDKNKLSVEVAKEKGVTYHISFIGVRKGKSDPEVFNSVSATEADFEISDDILFVRCKITSSKLQDNPIENLIYEMAWTQPVQRK